MCNVGEQAEETRKAWSYLMPAQIHLGEAAFANLGANVELSYGTSARLPGPRGGGRLLWARHGFLLVLSMAGRLSSSVVALRPIRFGRRRPQMRSSCNRWDGEQLREPSSDRRHENEAERSGDDYQPDRRCQVRGRAGKSRLTVDGQASSR